MADEKEGGKAPGDGKKMEKVYEMLWDCQYCGAKKLLGKTHRHCPHCGAAQDPNARYFPPDSEKVAVQDHVYFGADWKCAACEAPNSAKADFCGNCGAPKDGAGAVKLAHEKKEEKRLPAAQPPPPPKEEKGGGKAKYVGCCLGVVVLALIVVCGVFTFWKREDTVTVAGHTWARTIQVQEYQSLSKQEWCDNLPGGAYDVSSTNKQRDTKKVPAGEECTTKQVDNGDGTFREEQECKPKYAEEPIFDEWCTFKLDAWATSRTAEAKGQDLSPTWPAANPRACGGAPRLGCEQEGERNQTYTVLLRDSGGETHECAFDEARWRSLADGSTLKAKKRVIGGGVDCDSLQ